MRSEYLADGTHAGVRWYLERPADLAAPLVLVTLRCWDAAGNQQTERQELRAPELERKLWMAGLADAFRVRMDAKDQAWRKRRALRPLVSPNKGALPGA
jgi:hypothetical protein